MLPIWLVWSRGPHLAACGPGMPGVRASGDRVSDRVFVILALSLYTTTASGLSLLTVGMASCLTGRGNQGLATQRHDFSGAKRGT